MRCRHKIYDFPVLLGHGHWNNLMRVLADNETAPGKAIGTYPTGNNRSDERRNAAVDEWLDKMLEIGSTVTLDSPLCWFWEELLDRSGPDAKVILTKRVRRAGGDNEVRAPLVDFACCPNLAAQADRSCL